jgi:hypothetical protein
MDRQKFLSAFTGQIRGKVVKRDREEEVPQDHASRGPVVVPTTPPKPVILQTLPIKTLHDYSLSVEGQRDLLYLKRIDDISPCPLPTLKDVFSYIAKLPEQPIWYQTSQDAIVNSKSLNFPVLDVLTRKYIANFLHGPLKKGDPECKHPYCECQRLLDFRMIPLQLPGRTDGVWCYLCHLFETNKMYYESLNRKSEDKRVIQIHSFVVQVDIPGEYRLDGTLDGDANVKGLFGPFPRYNVRHWSKKGIYAIESDEQVFRLAQVTSL